MNPFELKQQVDVVLRLMEEATTDSDAEKIAEMLPDIRGLPENYRGTVSQKFIEAFRRMMQRNLPDYEFNTVMDETRI
jgi:hypothetical protein